MCGIIGFKGSLKEQVDIVEAMEALSHRGDDSFGCIHYSPTNKKMFLKKEMGIKNIAAWLETVPQEDTDFFLFHNRKASIGGVNLNLCHPITKGSVSVIHNGTKASIHTKFKELGDSDTEVMTNILSTSFNTGHLVKDMLDGVGVVFAQNSNGKLLFHTDNERPLFVSKERDIICSEPIYTGEWFLTINQTKMWNGFNDMIKNCEVHTKPAVIGKEGSELSYCYSCGKMHYIDYKDYLCYSCDILGLDDVWNSGYGKHRGYGKYSGHKTTKKDSSKKVFNFKVGQKYNLRNGSTVIITSVSKDTKVSFAIIGNITASTGTKFITGETWTRNGKYVSTIYDNEKDIVSLVDTSKKKKNKASKTETCVVGKTYLFSNDKETWTVAKLLENTKKGALSYKISASYGSRYFGFVKRLGANEISMLNKASLLVTIGVKYKFSNKEGTNTLTGILENIGMKDNKVVYFIKYSTTPYTKCTPIDKDVNKSEPLERPKIGQEYLFSNNEEAWYVGRWTGARYQGDFMVERPDKETIPFKYFKKFDLKETAC